MAVDTTVIRDRIGSTFSRVNPIASPWYAADDSAIRSKGTLYLVVHQHGQQMQGRWVGLSYDGALQTGFAAIARTQDAASQLLERPPA
jgi:hypothetical protein